MKCWYQLLYIYTICHLEYGSIRVISAYELPSLCVMAAMFAQ